MFRNLITLVEHNFVHTHVYHGTSKELAKELIDNGIDPANFTEGAFGYAFYTSDTPDLAEELSEEDDQIVLEYALNEESHILDLRDEVDISMWHRYAHDISNPHLWKILVRRGIDGLCDSSLKGICFYNPDALKFKRVYSGVVDDPLSETDTNQLDEFALGGLRRCTAVTVNALLKDFHMPPIQLSDVPVDNPGVLNILDMRRLAYKPFPFEVGKSVQQFVSTHHLGDWYLLTPGHAMALIRGELFDAENKGPDGRKLEAVFQITRR